MLSHGLITNWLDSLWLSVPTRFNNVNEAQMKAAEVMTAHQALRFVTARGSLCGALNKELPRWQLRACVTGLNLLSGRAEGCICCSAAENKWLFTSRWGILEYAVLLGQLCGP